jgi:hypothetical protein
MEVNDLIGLKEPLTKFIEYIGKGIGAISEPLLMRMINKAKIKNAKEIENFINNSELLIDYKNGDFEFVNYNEELNQKFLLRDQDKNIHILRNDLNISERSQLRQNHVSMKKQDNIEEIISNAFENFINDNDLRNKTFEKNVDEDWLNNFFEYAENISNEDMQKIWGKILSDEIKEPNSYSLRTLDSLRKMTHEDALRFEKFSKIIMFRDMHAFVFNNRNFLSQYNLSFGDLILLEDIGLINTLERSLTIDFSKSSNVSIQFTHQNNFILLENENLITIEIHKLTAIGYELAKLTTNNIDNDFIDKAGIYFKNMNKFNKVKLCTLIKKDLNDNSFFYSENKLY